MIQTISMIGTCLLNSSQTSFAKGSKVEIAALGQKWPFQLEDRTVKFQNLNEKMKQTEFGKRVTLQREEFQQVSLRAYRI